MGVYINPESMSKESWLSDHAVLVGTNQNDVLPLKFSDLKEGELFVCLVDNGYFTAAGIAYSEEELSEFNVDDGRYKGGIKLKSRT